jgi:hypothetical protein
MDELDIYPWTGHAVIMGEHSHPWQDQDTVLAYFGTTERDARKRYRHFIEERILMGKRPDLTGGGLVRSAGGWAEVASLRQMRGGGVSCGPLDRGNRGDPFWVSRNIKNWKLFIPDAFRVQARTNPQELREIAREVARKLNGSKGPVIFLIPLRGWSSLDKEGMPLYDPEADQTFVNELKSHLDKKIPIIEFDLHLNTREFAEEVVKQFLSIYEEKFTKFPTI